MSDPHIAWPTPRELEAMYAAQRSKPFKRDTLTARDIALAVCPKCSKSAVEVLREHQAAHNAASPPSGLREPLTDAQIEGIANAEVTHYLNMVRLGDLTATKELIRAIIHSALAERGGT